MSLLLLFPLLDRGFRDCNCGLKNRQRVVEEKRRLSLALDLNGIILRAVRGDAETAVAGASNGDGLVRDAELQADDQRVDVGGSNLYDANSFKELGVGSNCNFVAVVIDVRDGVRGAGGDGSEALLELLEGEGSRGKGKAAEP